MANPQRIKGIPGRKTDQKDSEWIAQLGRMGLVASSYIPSREIQELRSLTRTRKNVRNIEIAFKTFYSTLILNLPILFQISLMVLENAVWNYCLLEKKLVRQTISKRCKHSPSDIAEAMNGTFSKMQRILLESHLRSIAHIDEEITRLIKPLRKLPWHTLKLWKNYKPFLV